MSGPKIIYSHLRRAAFIAFCCLVSGCFEPEGENFVPISKPVFEGVDITLTDEDTDLYIYRPSRISYQVEQGDFQLIRIEGFLDNKSLFDPDNPTIISIDPAEYSSATYTFRIEATFLSNSNTLASKLAKETETISKQFNLFIDLQSPAPVNITSIAPRDGSLYISWEPPVKDNFINYRIRKYWKENNEWVDFNSVTPWIVEAGRTEVKDSLYTGGEIQYRVDIQGYTFATEGVPSDTYFQMITPSFETVGDDSVIVSWPPSPFYNNFDQIVLGEYNKPDVSFDPSQAVSYVTSSPFGSSYLQYAQAFPTGGFYSAVYMRRYTGQKFTFDGLADPLDGFQHYGNKELILRYGNPPVARLVNSADHSIIKTVDLAPYYASAQFPWSAERSFGATTPDGNNLFLFTGMEVQRFDSQLNFVEEIDFTDFNPGEYRFVYQVKLSNASVAAFYDYPGTVGVMDLENGVVIAKGLTGSDYIFDISPDGQYFTFNEKVYDISDGSMVEVGSFVNSTLDLEHCRFSAGSNKLFLSYRQGRIVTVDLGSMTIESEFDLDIDIIGKMQYDPISGLCAVQNQLSGYTAEFIVFDPISHAIVKRLNVSGICHLYNNTIYSDQGYSMPL